MRRFGEWRRRKTANRSFAPLRYEGKRDATKAFGDARLSSLKIHFCECPYTGIHGMGPGISSLAGAGQCPTSCQNTQPRDGSVPLALSGSVAIATAMPPYPSSRGKFSVCCLLSALGFGDCSRQSKRRNLSVAPLLLGRIILDRHAATFSCTP